MDGNSNAPVGAGASQEVVRGMDSGNITTPPADRATSMLAAALEWSSRNIPIFPCGMDKAPLTPKGHLDATTDPDQIRAWWGRYPQASIAMPTGGRSGVFAVDVDPPTGHESLEELQRQHGALPVTRTHRTGRGGLHHLFLYTGDVVIKNSASTLGKNLDIRGEGGYVVLQNAVGAYSVIDDTPPAPAPDWLLALLTTTTKVRSAPPVPPRQSSKATPYGLAALKDELAKLSTAVEGERNDRLNDAAFAMGQLIASGDLPRGPVETELLSAALSIGMGKKEAEKTIASGLNAGEREPRTSSAPRTSTTATSSAPPGEWPDPQPLTIRTAPDPYPIDAMPVEIRLAIEEVVAFVKAPLPLAAAGALGALSTAAQSLANVERANRLTGPIGLFLLSIAESGERKTTLDNFFTEAIRIYQREQLEISKPVLAKGKADLAAWEAKKSGIVEKIKSETKAGKPTILLERNLKELEEEKPEKVRVPELLRGDDTPESLAYDLANDWPAGAVISSEAGVVFGGAGMGKDRALRNMALLNILWDGGELPIKRRTGESFTVRGARLTVSLQIQEAALLEFFRATGQLARGTGFLARFLVSWPESTQGHRPFTEPPLAWPYLSKFNHRLAALLNTSAPLSEDGTLDPPALSFTADAKAAWVEYHDEIEKLLRAGGELCDVRDVASKSADNAARLAALFHLYQHGPGGAIGLESFAGASAIAAWHLNEARRFFDGLGTSAEITAATRLEAWLRGYCREHHTHVVPRREVQQYGPSSLRTKESLQVAIAELIELDRLREVKVGKSITLELNPALIGGDNGTR